MKIILNQRDGVIKGIVGKSSVPQALQEDEVEVVVQDKRLIEAFHEGEEIIYDPVTEHFYVQPIVHIDPEKQVLYEAIANLHEEIQELKRGGA